MRIKFLFIVSIVGALIGLGADKLIAQVYPITVQVLWDRNDPIDEVIDYTVVHNNGVTNQTFTIPAACPPITGQPSITCGQQLTIPGAGTQTVTVSGRNQWGSSVPVSITFTVKVPGNSRNIRITK